MDIKLLGRELSFTMKALMKTLAIEFHKNKIPLNIEQYIILRAVSHHRNLIQQDLAKMLMKDKSAILRYINELQADLLLARIPDPKDKRRNILVATKQGEELLNKAGQIQVQATKELIHGTSDDEIQNFFKVLSTIQKNASLPLGKANIN